MKKILSLTLMALMAGSLLCSYSCQKTEEEQFIADFEDFSQQGESAMVKECTMLEKVVEIKNKYKVDIDDFDSDEEWTKEDFKGSNLHMTKDQINEFNELRERFKDAVKILEDLR